MTYSRRPIDDGEPPEGFGAPRAQESLSLLRATLESTADGILVVDLNGRIVSYNQRFVQMWRIPPELLRARDDERALAYVVEQLADPASFLGKVRKLYSTPEAESFDVLGFRDGRVFERLSLPQRLRGRPVGRIWSFRDVTDRKRSERVQEATYRISEAVHVAQSLDELFRALHAIVSKLMPARNFYIALFDREQDTLSFPYFVDEYDSAPAPKPVGSGLTEYVLRTGQPLLASPEVFEELVHRGEVEPMGAPSVDWLGVPLRTARETIGVVVVQSYTEGVRFRETDRDLLTFVSTQLAMAVERKTATEALRESEERFRTLIEKAPIAIGMAREGLTVYANRKYLELYGFQSVDEVRGQSIGEQWAPEIRATIEERTRQRARGLPVPSEYEGIGRRKDGSRFPVHCVASLVQLADGPCGIGFLTDITERQEAEEALRREREFVEIALNSLPVAFYVQDRQGRHVRWNRTFEDLTGKPPDELKQRTGLSFIHAEDRAETVRKMKEVFEKGYAEVEARVLVRGGKEVRHFFLTGQRTEIGADVYLVGAGVDITARKVAEEALAKSELYYRSLIENAIDITAVLSREGIVRYASPSTERVLGYPAEERVGRNIFELIHTEDRPEAERRFQRSLEGESHFHDFELRFQHRDGSWRTLSVIGKPLPPETGVSGLILNARDSTERRQLEAQLLQAQKMEAVGRLAGGVAHDFNNLLTVIQGYGEMLSTSLGGEEIQRDQVGEILKAAERAATLTRQLLAFSRRQVLEMHVLDLGEVVVETEKMLRRLIGEDIELVVVKLEGPALVKADPGQIEQILLNLAVNSRDAMPKGGRLIVEVSEIELEEALATTPEPVSVGCYAVLTVGDNGMGMDAETLTHVFEPFFTTKEKGKGTGLGLATVYGIVKQSGGYITVASAPGEGTTFRIYLPRAQGKTAPRQEAVATGAGGVETVLLVEDEPAVRELACRLLQARGYHVLAAENGIDALARADRHEDPIHLLVTDLVMPGMSGRELAENLMSRRPETRVLFMSGYSSDPDASEGVRKGGARFLQKPFTEAALARSVRETLDAPAPDP